MAFSTKFLFDRVASLSKKDKAGYMSAQEFTDDVNQAQDLLYQFYYEQFEERQLIVDGLMPFLKEVTLPINSGYVDFPADYRHRIQIQYNKSFNEGCHPNAPTVGPYPMDYINANEEAYNESSAIRKGSTTKNTYYHTFINQKIRVLPRNLLGTVELKYLIKPPAALYAVTIDVTNQEENFDAANSIDLIWNNQDANNLVDIILVFKSIQTRESALVEWVIGKQKITKTSTI
jgi:hypothetical protein